MKSVFLKWKIIKFCRTNFRGYSIFCKFRGTFVYNLWPKSWKFVPRKFLPPKISTFKAFCTLFICFVLDSLFCSFFVLFVFCSKHLMTFKNTCLLSCWFHCVDRFYIKFRFCETFTVINSITRILLIETLYKFRNIKCWFTLYLYMYVLG